MTCWAPDRVAGYLEMQECASPPGLASVPGGTTTLYGTCYGLLTRHYLGLGSAGAAAVRDFVLGCQQPDTGWFVGPELSEWSPAEGVDHDREHLLLHLACAVLPTLAEFDWEQGYALRFAHRFCDTGELIRWLDQRDLRKAWLEGNNILFAGQLLVWLRDMERHPGAQAALDAWFAWLDERIDPASGLWGTDHGCSAFEAMCGGYHQLLVYYHEKRPIRYPQRLVDTVLEVQHPDGGFARRGGGGACEDVDAVDILVNLYKLHDYRRPAIRLALRRCMRHIMSIQNEDGGFPYKRGASQSHMGIPATRAPANASTMFATWFRVHTLALIAEILTDEPALSSMNFRFSRSLSMGWHRPWNRAGHAISAQDRAAESSEAWRQAPSMMMKRMRSTGKRIKRVLKL